MMIDLYNGLSFLREKEGEKNIATHAVFYIFACNGLDMLEYGVTS